MSSDNTAHTKFEIACYLYKIVSKIPASVTTLKLWSDGPNSQFKNRFMGALLKVLENAMKIKIFWNFFATSHGKGCVDGIGAVVKNRVKRLVKTRQQIVNCSTDFARAFNSENSVVKVTHMTDNETKEIRMLLKLDGVFDSAPPITDIFNHHQLQLINGKIMGFSTSEEGYAYFEKFCKKNQSSKKNR